jgi:hypothetical protein
MTGQQEKNYAISFEIYERHPNVMLLYYNTIYDITFEENLSLLPYIGLYEDRQYNKYFNIYWYNISPKYHLVIYATHFVERKLVKIV